jgi:hypothetical protein
MSTPYCLKPPTMPVKADPKEIAVQNAFAAMDRDPWLKGTAAAKKYGASY